MILDALRWNMLNLIRVELFFDCYNIWDVFVHSSLKSPTGQYAIASLLITLFAQLTVQFNLTWFMSIYTIYLAVGLCAWIHRRVWFYHRKLDRNQVKELLGKMQQLRPVSTSTDVGQYGVSFNTAGDSISNNGNGGSTLKHSKHHKDHHSKDAILNGLASSSSSSASSASSSASNSSDNTNSLQRQRYSAYQSFPLNEPRRTHKEFALSLAHLSNIAKLLSSDDTYDEMHFQLLTTRRDVINIVLRFLLLAAGTLLAQY